MINSNDLPRNQCYLEYPDGKITLVSFSRATRDFMPVRKLSNVEAASLRGKFGLGKIA
jgi:hypothetical protein